MKEYNCENILKKIKETAKKEEITQKKLLETAKLNPTTLVDMKKSMPKSDNLSKIADVLDVSVDYLLDRTDNPKSHKL